ncbi:hypothetical protein [Limimaricola cinnabarinus]|uniref:hypothetical protein n=1 Tax=Limimaricola cinnabarinus TaxID=1125964 RepID=UPI0024924538|nr:hypothetical protein [Limimaricola cinnabarinus]
MSTRLRALSIVSTGTTFAVAGLGMGIASAIWLRGITRGERDGEPLGAWRSLLRWDILPPAFAAYSFGLGAAVWFSFAVDAAARAGPIWAAGRPGR